MTDFPQTEPSPRIVGLRRSSCDARFYTPDGYASLHRMRRAGSSPKVLRTLESRDGTTEATLVTKVVDFNRTDSGESTVRPRWRTRVEYMLTCFGFAVGLPSVWRFPYVCYENGGGSFLIVYLLLSVSIAIPMYQLELSLGQSLQSGFLRIWPAFSPHLVGLGLSSLILAAICAVYFSAINSWTLLYFLKSFTYPHPWHTGGNTQTDSALKFYLEDVLHKSSSISSVDFSNLNVGLLTCLVLSCMLVLLAMSGGSPRASIISAFAALFPVIGLLTLFTHASQLTGSWIGLKFFLMPSFAKILSIRLWGRALLQVFFSGGIGWGSLVNFASFSDPRNDFQKDAWSVLGMNVFTSVLAGLTTFALLGHVAHQMSAHSIDGVVQAGSGIIFVVFPAVLESSLWSRGLTTTFFLLIVSLGLSSILTMMALVQTGLEDLSIWTPITDKQIVKSAILVACLFLLAVPLILPNGVYLVDLLDSSTGAIALLALPLAEVLAVTRITKYERFVRRSTGVRLRLFFSVILKYVLPVLLGALIVGAISDFHEARVRRMYRLQVQSAGCPLDCMRSEGHGECVIESEFCQCKAGWEGLDCNTPTKVASDIGCPGMCRHQGLCDGKTGHCVCNVGFYGPTCGHTKYDESMPMWTVLLSWFVALGSLLPAFLARISPRWQQWLIHQMLVTKDIVAWTPDDLSEDEESEDAKLGMVTYKV